MLWVWEQVEVLVRALVSNRPAPTKKPTDGIQNKDHPVPHRPSFDVNFLIVSMISFIRLDERVDGRHGNTGSRSRDDRGSVA